jgi:DNA-binding transcriptional regulator YiaG
MTSVLDDEAVLAARALVEALEARAKGPVKVRDLRAEHRSNVHAAYVISVDEITKRMGWSRSQLAHHVGVERETLNTWYHYGDQRQNQWPAWVFSALPVIGRTAFMRASMAWIESAPDSKASGTHG